MSPTLALILLAWGTEEPATVEFGRDVQPILAKHCFVCHGPDQGTRKAKLSVKRGQGSCARSSIEFVPCAGMSYPQRVP